MKVIFHESSHQKIAEVRCDDILINSEQDALDLMVNPELSRAHKIILDKKNFAPDFLELRTGLAGKILQKFVNYRVQLAIVGDFKNISSESMNALIVESNRGKNLFFLDDVEKARKVLSAS